MVSPLNYLNNAKAKAVSSQSSTNTLSFTSRQDIAYVSMMMQEQKKLCNAEVISKGITPLKGLDSILYF
jgi:hypothetical protein